MEGFIAQYQEQLTALLRVILAMAAGAAIGYNREKVNQAAGLRTYMAVSAAGAFCALLSIFISRNVGSTDLGRLPAAFISGMGFLGAGTIWRNRDAHVSGVDTAAGLWAMSLVGLGFGMGYYFGAALLFLCVLFAVILMRAPASGMEHIWDNGRLYAELKSRDDLKYLLELLDSMDAGISEMDLERMEGGAAAVTMLISEEGNCDISTVLDKVRSLGCVTFAIFI